MEFFKKDELKLLWPFYFDALFVNILYLYPIFYLIYFRDIGLSLAQIGLLGSAWSLAAVLFEIPTGAIADIFGRKASTILGMFLSGTMMAITIFFTNFYMLFVLFFVRGMVGTLSSGADQAWVVDLLHHKKRKNLVHEYFVKIHSFVSVGVLISGILGAVLVKRFGLGVIWPVTGGTIILSSIVFLFGQEYFVRKKQRIRERAKELFSHSKESIKYSIKNKSLFLLLIVGMITMTTTFFSSDITWFPFLQNLGFQEHWFGYLVSASFALGIFIPYLTKPLSKKIGSYKKYLILFLMIQLTLLLTVGLIGSLIFAIIIYLLFFYTYDFYHPVNTTFYQQLVPGKMRATIGSFKNMTYSIVAIFIFPLVGFIADKIGPQSTIFIGAFILIPAIYLYSLIKEKGEVR